MINTESANIIYNRSRVRCKKKSSGMRNQGMSSRLDKERDQLHEDVYQFLEKLDWEE